LIFTEAEKWGFRRAGNPVFSAFVQGASVRSMLERGERLDG
jgi:hypothetical protein